MKWFTVPIKLWNVFCSLILITFLSGCLAPIAVIPTTPQPTTSPDSIATYHTVKAGETLYSIAQRYGRNYQDIALWNKISPPYEVASGQLLRVDGSPKQKNVQPTLPSVPESGGIPVVTPNIPKPTPLPETPTFNPNETKNTHIVQPGETLYAVAKQYGVSFSDIANWNYLESPYNLSIGQVLVISSAGGTMISPPSMPKQTKPKKTKPSRKLPTAPTIPKQKNEDYHIVLPGDTLYKIAKHYGYTIEDIASWNGLNPPYNLALGQQLQITPSNGRSKIPQTVPAISAPGLEPENAGGQAGYHVVALGDTLYGLAKRYNCNVSDLTRWNNLGTSPVLSLGQSLRVTNSNKGTVNIPTRNKNYHIVKPGETLYNVSKQYGLDKSDLVRWNGLISPYNLSIGQQLKLFPSETSRKKMPGIGKNSTSSHKNSYLQQVGLHPNQHIVQKGENLADVAKKYRVSIIDLADWNGIGSPYTVYPGQKIRVAP